MAKKRASESSTPSGPNAAISGLSFEELAELRAASRERSAELRAPTHEGLAELEAGARQELDELRAAARRDGKPSRRETGSRSAANFTDEQMEFVGASAGHQAFLSALLSGAKVPYLVGDQVLFAAMDGNQVIYGLTSDDAVRKRDDV